MEPDKPLIYTSSGKIIDIVNFQVEYVELDDISRALANQCRYNGLCTRFYSVAQHSAIVALLLYRDHNDSAGALAALLHDAAEAYLGDITRPVKRLGLLSAVYTQTENLILDVIMIKYKILDSWHKYRREIKKYDDLVNACEVRTSLINHTFESSPDTDEILNNEYFRAVLDKSMLPDRAEAFFLRVFELLVKRI